MDIALITSSFVKLKVLSKIQIKLDFKEDK